MNTARVSHEYCFSPDEIDTVADSIFSTSVQKKLREI